MKPPSPDLFKEAVKHHRGGRLPTAEALYRQILSLDPRHAGALNLLGLIGRQTGRLKEALELIRAAIAISPANADYHFNLAEALRALGDYNQAIQSYRLSLGLRPEDAEVHHALALALDAGGMPEKAEASYREALRQRPEFPIALRDLGGCLARLRQSDEAEPIVQQAIQRLPNDAVSKEILGEIFLARHRFAEGESAFRAALSLNVRSARAWYGLGVCLVRQGKPTEGIRSLEEALRLKPGSAETLCQLGASLLGQGRADDAIGALRRALALCPNFHPAHSSLIFTLNYQPDVTPESLLAEARRWAQRHPRPLPIVGETPTSAIASNAVRRRLRIGYVSPSLRAHTITAFLEPILAHHDHSQFEVFCYSDTPRPDDITARLRSHADVWRDTLGCSDAQLTNLIRGDGIDILVDLAGHTGDNRLRVFGMLPAPMQVSYLEYPSTTGMDAIDYKITDAIADPPGIVENHYTEHLLRLPGCAWCYRPFAGAPEPGEPPCLRSAQITFGSFNNYAKVTEPILALWSTVLSSLHNSRLLMLLDTDLEGVERVKTRLEAAGIDRGRVQIVRRLAYRAYLQLLSSVDVSLDTFPYNGHTTTCDALWMGVPVVTLAGQRHVSRVGASLLSALDQRQWVAQTPQEYSEIALILARNSDNLRNVRATLRGRMAASPLTDAPAFTRKFEAALQACCLEQ